MKKKYALLLCIILCVGLVIALFFILRPADKTNVTTARVSRGDIVRYVMATGILKPSVQVNVGAQVTGQIKKIYVTPGSKVEKGQLLAEIDPVLQQNELRKATAQLASAMAQKRSTTAQLTKARLEYQRQKQLDRDNAGVRSALEQAQAQYIAEQQQLAVDESQIQQARIAVEIAKVNLNYTRITAPITGEILGIVTNEGQTVVSTQSAPTILVIANLEQMRVQIRISENDILRVKPDLPLWFSTAAEPSKRYHSVIDNIQPVPVEALTDSALSPSSQNSPQQSAVYYTGEFLINNPDGVLKTWMTAQVYIETVKRHNVLRIPVEALERLADGSQRVNVLTAQGQRESVTVTSGISDRQFTEILSGLKDGEIIVMPQEAFSHG